ncbi:CobW family GTP-binding protein [Planotetraspora phitsanulokensis]|nr:GTP-binding protein [Planotetraspora phitsanulokensis]
MPQRTGGHDQTGENSVTADQAPDPVPATGATALPVAIVTGFLGSGKTTFVRGLLDAGGSGRTAVIVNELGELGIDGALLEGAARSVIELPGGCMCCESRGDVGRALALLAERASELDAVVVETSGVSDPLGVADLLAHGVFPADLRLSQVVTVVDAENFDRNLADADAAYSQIVSADLFVVGKSDLVAPDVVTAIGERLAVLNPHAAVLPSDGGRSAAGLLGEVAGVPAISARRQAVHTEPGYDSVAWETNREIGLDRLLAWVEALPPNIYRVKALVRQGRTDVAVHRVGARVTVLASAGARREPGDGRTRVVAIGRGIAAESMRAELDAMEPSDEETA